LRKVSVVVVYVHGLWLNGYESLLLRQRLSRHLGATTRTFSYPSVSANINDNAMALGRYLKSVHADTVHLVGHSLGGLVILKLFELGFTANGLLTSVMALPAGRVVLMGSPVQGCLSAQRVARLPLGLGRAMLGATAGEVLLDTHERRWDGMRELGVIAGDLPIGLGRLTGKMTRPNDGTVLVDETSLPGATAQLRLRVSHTALPFSAAVARHIADFLQHGQFDV
jgi:pimeloyl-ACP methyl ester carboxylesterase